MSDICDRSPCDQLLRSLGRWISYSPSENVFFMSVAPEENSHEWPVHVVFKYCPFCGTRLSEVPVMVERFTKSRRRHSVVHLSD